MPSRGPSKKSSGGDVFRNVRDLWKRYGAIQQLSSMARRQHQKCAREFIQMAPDEGRELDPMVLAFPSKKKRTRLTRLLTKSETGRLLKALKPWWEQVKKLRRRKGPGGGKELAPQLRALGRFIKNVQEQLRKLQLATERKLARVPPGREKAEAFLFLAARRASLEHVQFYVALVYALEQGYDLEEKLQQVLRDWQEHAASEAATEAALADLAVTLDDPNLALPEVFWPSEAGSFFIDCAVMLSAGHELGSRGLEPFFERLSQRLEEILAGTLKDPNVELLWLLTRTSDFIEVLHPTADALLARLLKRQKPGGGFAPVAAGPEGRSDPVLTAQVALCLYRFGYRQQAEHAARWLSKKIRYWCHPSTQNSARHIGLLATILGTKVLAEVGGADFGQKLQLASTWLVEAQYHFGFWRKQGPYLAPFVTVLAVEALRSSDEYLNRAKAERVPAQAAETGEPLEAPEEVNVFRQRGDFWYVSFSGESARLAHLIGYRYIAHLLGRPEKAIPCRELRNLVAPAPRPSQAEKAHAEDTARETAERSSLSRAGGTGVGDVTDQEALEDYRSKLKEMDDEIAKAREEDPMVVPLLEKEREVLLESIQKDTNARGLPRQFSSDAERARKAVSRAIIRAKDKIDTQLPSLGKHLLNTLHLGKFCSYSPASETEWQI